MSSQNKNEKAFLILAHSIKITTFAFVKKTQQIIMEALKAELKEKIIEVLNLEDISVEDINDDDVLFGDGLGLDSIDALELIVLLDKDYGIKLTDPKEGKTIFQSISTMAAYIEANRKK